MADRRTWVDRGGTFTDVVTWDGVHAPVARKVRSDEAVVGDLAEGTLVFGTTVATNALLERTGRPTLLAVTAGFGDLHRIRHMARPALFDPDADWPASLATRVVEVPGRIAADGRVLDPARIPELPDDVEQAAVVLLHGPRAPEQERAVADQLGIPSVCGHAVDPEVGYLARIETTLVDAAITPVLADAVTADRIPGDAFAIRSDGGLVRAGALRAPDAVLSGPAGGVLAVAAIARQAGFAGVVGLDMGGTSTDVCCVLGDELPRQSGDVPVAGVFLRRPMLEVETIAAGGGSVLRDDGTRLRVGPQSAGADPGPQCYGRGGPPTLTDAALLAGLLDPHAFSPPLDPGAVSLPGSAEDFLAVGREAMAAAVRRLASRRGVDVRPLALVAYGGAAGQHAAAVAERLQMRTVLVHPFAAVLSAWGQTLAVETHERVRALWSPLEAVWGALPEWVDALRAQLPALPIEDVLLELRPEGTDDTLTVRLDALDAVRANFLGRYEAVHGHAATGPIELVNLRVRVSAAPVDVPAPDDDPWGVGDRVIPGPARLDCTTTAISVPAGWRARRWRGLLRLDREGAQVAPHDTTRTARGVAVWASRFMAVASSAGETLRRTARSVNIRERRDFSAALFDGDGRLVANAPHIPVHLGAMGETVRDILAHEPSEPGQSWLGNDPAAGGSHLPDLTVVTEVALDGVRFFVATRAHHVDVGGITPGSMPPHATHLAQEGMVLRRVPLTRGGQLRDLVDLVSDSRQPAVVAADLRAQLAANTQMVRGLAGLGPGPVVRSWMGHLRDAARDAIRAILPTLTAGSATDTLAGVPLHVAVSPNGDRLIVDWTGTGGPHTGNLNAPPAVVRAAVLYVLRVLVADDIPLNEGVLDLVDMRLPPRCLLTPPAGAAVAGGNVETSQRLVDLLFAALGVRAASQGTMNNLTLGGNGWSLYETLGGGQGASATADGRSANQVHMTNTRATDPEVAELRLPIRVQRFERRSGSGGAGHHRGGDGLIREIELLTPGTVALLASRREHGAPGLGGGGSGLPGVDAVFADGAWCKWDGQPRALRAGDKVRIETPGGGGFGATE